MKNLKLFIVIVAFFISLAQFLQAKNIVDPSVQRLQKASQKGDINAMFDLAICYENGTGVKQDLKQAHKLYRKAAEAGLDDAKFNLGAMYFNGVGCELNFPLAYACFSWIPQNSVKYEHAQDVIKLLCEKFKSSQSVLKTGSEYLARLKKKDFSVFDLNLIGNSAVFADLLKDNGVRYYIQEDGCVTTFHSGGCWTADIVSCPIEDKSVFVLNTYVFADFKKYSLKKETIYEFLNSLHTYRLDINAPFIFKRNYIAFSFVNRNVKTSQDVAQTFSDVGDLLSYCTTALSLFCENKIPLDIAVQMSSGFCYGELPLDFKSVRKFEKPEFGYMVSFVDSTGVVVFDEYRYDLAKTWKDGVSDEGFGAHFAQCSKDVFTAKKNVKSLSRENLKIAGCDVAVEKFSLKFGEKGSESFLYLTAKNGKLLKFRVSYPLPVSKENLDAIQKTLEARLKADF